MEDHFYQGLLAQCSFDAQHRLNKFPDGQTKLNSLDRKTLTYLLQPLLKLRQACTHPQVRGEGCVCGCVCVCVCVCVGVCVCTRPDTGEPGGLFGHGPGVWTVLRPAN